MIDYFSHIPILHLAMYCIIFAGEVIELMFTVHDACFSKVNFFLLEMAIKQHFKQYTNDYFIKMD